MPNRLGELKTGNDSIRAFLFRARPDGQRADVLVAWSESEAALELPKPPKACFDHLGRAREVTGKALKLSRAPLFVVLAGGTRLPLVPPPEPPKLLPGKPSPLVLQAVLPEESIVLEKSAYKIPAGQTTTIPIFLYNFGSEAGPRAAEHLRVLQVRHAGRAGPVGRRVSQGSGSRAGRAERTGTAPHRCQRPTVVEGGHGSDHRRVWGAGRPVLSLNLVPGVN